MRMCCVCGARPNFVKMDAILRASRADPAIESFLVHTGQHYDDELSESLFRDLEMPPPDVELAVGSATHAVQTARLMERFEPVVKEMRPDLVLVVGDVNSTLACSLVAAKLGFPIAHVEAGLRSFDRTMPEEVNRVLTDAISDLLFVSEPSGLANLAAEGISEERVFLTGNVMIDTLLRCRGRASESGVLERLGLNERGFAVLTLHRPANVDDPAVLTRIVLAIEAIAERLPVVFPVHPRTRRRLRDGGLASRLQKHTPVHLVEPLGYLDFLHLMDAGRLVLTDSGGIQEETTVLGVPCLTLRENTERPSTVERGTNRIVGTETRDIVEAAEVALSRAVPEKMERPELWDGRAADRIVSVLREWGTSTRSTHGIG